MKLLILFLAFSSFVFFLSCKKSEQRPAPINCVGLITDTLGTGDNMRLFIPSAFSPNGDGLNDGFLPVGVSIAGIDIKVYDENNNMLYNSLDSVGLHWYPSVPPNTFKKYNYRVQASSSYNHHIGICGDLYIVNCIPGNFDTSLLIFRDQITLDGFTNPTAEVLTNRICN